VLASPAILTLRLGVRVVSVGAVIGDPATKLEDSVSVEDESDEIPPTTFAARFERGLNAYEHSVPDGTLLYVKGYYRNKDNYASR
jgi:hypothetical protein